MKSMENSGNRIRGWFPKELFKFSFQANVYSEWVSVGKFVKTFAGSILMAALVVLEFAIWFSISTLRNLLFGVVMSLPVIFVALLYLNFRGIGIKITSNELKINYGILNRKYIQLSEIISCERTKANFVKYLGVGVRYGVDGTYVYSASFGNAVRISQVKGRPFVFSSNNPDDACNTINRIKQVGA